ncbi:Uncharacterised protein [Mycobacteroides abscessus subsp. abscessus]|nr:Uncharacterised protein [Mycobacteroides abscessus subsp. abscessus]
MIRPTCTLLAIICSRLAPLGGGFSRAISWRGPGGGRNGWLLLDMMMETVAVRSGCSAANTCAIMPPIEAPTMCACSMPR